MFGAGVGMTNFEFALSLFGLVFGLSIVEVMAGFARVLRARPKVRLGWSTPLLGILLIIDLVTFWANAWELRQVIPPSFWTLLAGTAIAAIYYLSAAVLFPHDLDQWSDLDAYFVRHKAQVILGIIAANLLFGTCSGLLLGSFPPVGVLVKNLVFTALSVGVIFARRRWLETALLLTLLVCYAVSRISAAPAG
ncbi:MAG TPA: hypothetical protein VMG08_03855 [Allosphingosinicella sp.]|nr:hypothetical protein [Allosphingosinicella sp.]